MWMDVKYEPGTIKVVAFGKDGKPVAEKEIHTASHPHHLELKADRKEIDADGKDLSYVTVSVVDKDGNLCPNADNQLNFEVSGAGTFKAVCNGDATSLEMFHHATMKAFSGKLVVTVQSLNEGGIIDLEVSGTGIENATIRLKAD
jgi:beta-galactosidase